MTSRGVALDTALIWPYLSEAGLSHARAVNPGGRRLATVERIAPQEAHARVVAGQALLVCAYEDPARFAEIRLEGAISIQEFRARRHTLPQDQEIIFYCT